MSTASRSGCASTLPALSARVPIVSYRTIRLRVWYLARAAAKHLMRHDGGTDAHQNQEKASSKHRKKAVRQSERGKRCFTRKHDENVDE